MIPKISVIVLTYNSSDTLREALDSVLRQKCGYDFEIVAGDDGSTDLSLIHISEPTRPY